MAEPDDNNFAQSHFRCSPCDVVLEGVKNFIRHHRNINHQPPYRCAYCTVGFCQHLRSLVRHFKMNHPNGENNVEEIAGAGNNLNENNEGDNEAGNADGDDIVNANSDVDEDDVNAGANAGAEGGAGDGGDVNAEQNAGAEGGAGDELQDLRQAAALCTLNLRQSSAITSSAIQRFQVECNEMVQKVSANSILKVREFFTAQGIEITPAARALLEDLKVQDSFTHVRTLKQQLNYFSKEFGMVKPVTKFLDYRRDYFLNPDTAQYEPVQVPMSFEYISIIEILTLALSNPKIRVQIEADGPSNDGVLRSYLDGTRSKTHSMVIRFPGIIRIQLYWDDVEVVNPLGSKTTIHKLAAFYIAIQNLPNVEKFQVSSIFLLTLAHSEDLKTPGGFEKVLAPFLQEMRKLESDRGVTIMLNNQPFVLRATLTTLVADTLAAHEILGLLGPGARCFCRACMITRQEFHQDCNAMGQRRTKAMLQEHARQVSERPAFSTECGVRKECPLHATKDFDASQDAVFDIFHDLLEGVCQWDVSLALRTFIKYQKLFTVEEFNQRLASFNYGVMDIKNKPSPNFTDKSLRGKKLKQTGSQVWCLIRVFGFLVPEVPEDDVHLMLVNKLQRIMLTVFSDRLRPADPDDVDNRVTDHHALYQQVYMNNGQEVLAEEDDGERVDDPDDVEVVVEGNRRVVNPGNKMHHMKHYGAYMRYLGPLFPYWCARYEARHQIFSRYGAVCGNFINPPKTMAQMFQMSTLSSFKKSTMRLEDIEVSGAGEAVVEDTEHSEMLLEFGIAPGTLMEIANSVTIAGEQYRPGNFVLLDPGAPTFAIIQRVYATDKKVYLIVQPWVTLAFVDRFCAYEVEPALVNRPLVQQHDQLPSHGCFAPWNPWRSRRVFIAPRTIIF